MIPNKVLGFAEVGIKTKYGELAVRWEYLDNQIKYELTIPKGMVADVRIPNINLTLYGGSYVFYGTCE